MNQESKGKTFLNFAHRGASGYCPENTMAAFVKGLELGANGIETDVQMTADGRLVLIHDETLDRTTNGAGRVMDLSWDEIRTKDAGSWFGSEFHGSSVPVIEELFELAKDRDVILNVELKNNLNPYHGMEEALVRSIREFGLESQVIVSSFNHYSLAHFKKLAPDMRTAILYSAILHEPWTYAASIGADALHPPYRAVTAEWVKEAGKRGTVYHPYTVNDIATMQTLIDMGVAGIITDYPDRLAALIGGGTGTGVR